MPALPSFDGGSISRIERALSLELPAAYRRALRSYPFDRDSEPYWWALFGSEDRIVEENERHRTAGFFGQPWPAHYLIIGGDGTGNVWACPQTVPA